MSRGSLLTLNDIPEEIRRGLGEQFQKQSQTTADSQDNPLDIKGNEKAMIIQALAKCDGNRTKAAEMLGISRRTLHRKINEYSL
ncbi:MAG: hypothetical protein J6866_06085 [Victivallales bacterium]|nr:hypothetical protein [Victivallales bacterium]